MCIRPSRMVMLAAAACAACLAAESRGFAQADAPAPAQAPAGAQPLPGPEPVPEPTLGSALPTKPIMKTVRGYRDPLRANKEVFNEQWIDTRPLPSDKPTQLDYTGKTADFTVGKLITGADSKATAVVSAKDDQGEFGTLNLVNVRGTFQDGEALADDAGGAAAVKGRLKEGVWVLDFAFKPLRIREMTAAGKRKNVYYLYFQVVNRTGKPRVLAPQFNLSVPSTGKLFPDSVIPAIVPIIEQREDPTIKLLGAVDIMGMIPPSTKDGVDDAVFGVAVWDDVPPEADFFSIYVRGLSNYSFAGPPDPSGKSTVKYKTLRIDFRRRGDKYHVNEREIELADPPYEWVYW